MLVSAVCYFFCFVTWLWYKVLLSNPVALRSSRTTGTTSHLNIGTGFVRVTFKLPIYYVRVKCKKSLTFSSRIILQRPLCFWFLLLIIVRAAQFESVSVCMWQVLCNIEWIVNKLTFRSFSDALHDIDLVSSKDVDIRLVESIFLSSRFLPTNPRLLPQELLSRFSRAPGANSPVISRMVAEAEVMISTTSDRCIVPLYPCVSPSSAGVRRPTHYRPTHVLAFNTVQPEQKETQLEESPTQYEEEAEDSTTQAVVWGARCGLQVWRTGPDNNTFQFDYRICNGVSLSVIAKYNKAYTTGLQKRRFYFDAFCIKFSN